MARCGCGGSDRCSCAVVAGDRVTVEGNGSPSSPYVISAGEDAGAVETGAGLTGDGRDGAPIEANVSSWPYEGCTVDEAGGQVYVDATGQLRGEPRSLATYVQDSQNVTYDDVDVPGDYNEPIETRTLTIENPDPCREAFVVCEVEVDIDFNLPAGSGAAGGILTDEMQYFANTGSGAANDVHGQVTKTYNRTIPAGETLEEPLQIVMGRGTGGATYNRVQSFMRAFVFVL